MSTNDHETDREKLREALELIRNAADGEKEHLEQLLQDEFSELREVLGEKRSRIADKVHEQRERLAAFKDEGVDRARRVADRVDHYVHAEPWWVLGASAASALLAGYLIGRDRS